jgi:Spy/CpxP family protein refolding chaperone
MKTLKSCVAGAAIAALLAGGATVLAQGPAPGPRRGGPAGPGGFGRGGGSGLDLPLRELNLTDAQQQQVKAIRDRHRDESQQLSERLRTALEEQRKAVETEPVNDSLIRQATQQLSDVEADIAVAQAHVRSEVMAVLTADQKAQLQKMQADRQAQAQQLRQRFQRGRGQRQ